jgi:hypothetical protein
MRPDYRLWPPLPLGEGGPADHGDRESFSAAGARAEYRRFWSPTSATSRTERPVAFVIVVVLMHRIFAASGAGAYVPVSKPVPPSLDGPASRKPSVSMAAVNAESASDVLRRPIPGALFAWVKRASWLELGLFCALLVFWVLPGFEHETFIFGLAHGIGFIVLCVLIWIAVLRREAPYGLLAATLTPAGPVGSVIGIAWIERHRPPASDDPR